MKEKDNNSIYCAFCGTKNKIEDKKCKKCNKKLNPKNHLLKDYLKDHIKDDVKCNLEDDIQGLIIEWIKAHLFGIFGTALIGILAVGVIINEVNINNTKKKFAKPINVNSAPTLKKTCNDLELVDKIKVCDTGYTLENDKCVKTTKESASSKKTCPNGYTLSNNKCISNNTTAKSKKVSCSESKAPSGDGRFIRIGIYKSGDKCYAKMCVPLPGSAAPSTKSDCDMYRELEFTADITYYCTNYTDSNGNCRNVANQTTKYYCNKGTLNGKECIIKDSKSYKEECPSGTVYNTSCSKCEKVGG